MWTREKSIFLSKLFVGLFMGLLVLFILGASQIVSAFGLFSRADIASIKAYFVWTIYIGSIPAGILLVSMMRLMHNIERGEVFISLNVKLLRMISWSCFAGALVAVGGMFYYFPWIFVVISASFMGLIVRILKNAFEQAVVLKEEVDYTI